jgi:hypothetical protein
MADEAEWVALRELVPSATAPLALLGSEFAERELLLTTVLPMAYPALVKPDGRVFLGVQANGRSGDLSRDLAAVLEIALASEPGVYVAMPPRVDEGPRLQDLVASAPLSPTLHETFAYWLDGDAPAEGEVAEGLERANASIIPTARMEAVPAAYWCRVPEKEHLRWVLPEGEEVALDALARLRAGGSLTLGAGTRYAGAFRAHGLLVPVFDLPMGGEASAWESPLAELAKAYAEAVVASEPLTSLERSERSVLAARHVTLR